MFFRKILNYFKNRKNNKQIIRSLSYGDIIWCDVKKYKNIKFKKNHQIRPYFVVEVTKTKIKCIPFTHRINKSFYCFYINENHGSLILSNGIFNLKYKHFENLDYKEKLSDLEISKITKRLFIYYNNSKEVSTFSKYIKFLPNDIVIRNNKYYLLYDVSDSKYTLYEFSKIYKPSFSKVDKSFYVKTSPVVVSDVNSLTYFNTFKDYKVLILDNYFKTLKNKEKQRRRSKKTSSNDVSQTLSTIDVGTRVTYKNKVYIYIGSIDKKGCLVETNYASSTWIDDDVVVKRHKMTTTKDELTFLKNMFFQK